MEAPIPDLRMVQGLAFRVPCYPILSIKGKRTGSSIGELVGQHLNPKPSTAWTCVIVRDEGTSFGCLTESARVQEFLEGPLLGTLVAYGGQYGDYLMI